MRRGRTARDRITDAMAPNGWRVHSEYGVRVVRYERGDVWITVTYSSAGSVTNAIIADGSGVLFKPRTRKADEVIDVLLRQAEVGD